MTQSGFEVILSTNDWVENELTIIARKKEHAPPQPATVSFPDFIDPVIRSLKWLESVIVYAREVSTRGHFGLFGTSIAATWLSGELTDSVSFFVDEDPHRIGRSFLGHPVYPPVAIPSDSHVFIALPDHMTSVIRMRMEKLSPRVNFYDPAKMRRQ